MNRFDISCFHLLAAMTCVLVPVSFLTAREPPPSSDIAKTSGISGDHIDGVTPPYSTFFPDDKASQTHDGERARDEGQQTDRKERITELRRELEEARKKGDQQEVDEIQELLRRLKGNGKKDGEAGADRRPLEEGEGPQPVPPRIRALEREIAKAREAGNKAEVREIQALLDRLRTSPKTDVDEEEDVDLTLGDNDIIIAGGGLSLRFGRNGHVKELTGKDGLRFACKGATVYRIENQRASVSDVERTARGLRVSLEAGGKSAVVSVEGGNEMTIRFRGEDIRYVTFGFGLPRSARFHQAKHNNLVVILDQRRLRQGPVRSFSGGGFQILVAELSGGFLSVSGRSDYKTAFLGSDRAYVSLCRARSNNLAFEYTWRPEFPLVLSWHDSLESAAAKYRKWMEKFFGLKPLKDSPAQWLEHIKLVITFDMGRSNGDRAHSYQDLINLANKLHQAGAKGGILFYLPSWYGKYDAEYPDYTPKDWLGGKQKFKEMVDVLHACGYRVLIHFLPWGADPFSPEFGKIKQLAVKSGEEMSRENLLAELDNARAQGNEAEVREIQELINRFETRRQRKHVEHPMVGWPACYPAKESDYDSSRQKLAVKRKGSACRFSTISLPRTFETHITLGGIQLDSGRVKLSVNARSLSTPQGHFSSHDEYTFPYTFLLYQGRNDISLEFPDGRVPDLSRAWYRIHDAIYSDAIHTYPIVRMDVTNDDWMKLFSDRVIEVVGRYKIDAVHLDASHLWDLMGSEMKINRRLMDALPDVVFSTEIPTESSMMMYQIAQTGIVPEDAEDGAYSPLAGLIAQPYRRLYQHLCAAEGFVSVAKVCNVDREPRPYTEEQLQRNRQVFRLSPIFGLIRNIRVNYRDFGLDVETRRAVLSLYPRDGVQ